MIPVTWVRSILAPIADRSVLAANAPTSTTLPEIAWNCVELCTDRPVAWVGVMVIVLLVSVSELDVMPPLTVGLNSTVMALAIPSRLIAPMPLVRLPPSTSVLPAAPFSVSSP